MLNLTLLSRRFANLASVTARYTAVILSRVVERPQSRRKCHLSIGIGVLAVLVASTHSSIVTTQGTSWYVSPDGSPDAPGTAAQPLDLATALSGAISIRPGDTIWLRHGTYRGSFVSYLQGTASAPIVVRQYPGERATIDSAPTNDAAALTVYGSNTWYWGFEVMSSGVDRQFPLSLDRGTGLVVQAPNTKFINLVVHDTDMGYGMWIESENAEIYGNLIYYNGQIRPTDGDGRSHGVYTQSRQGTTRRIADNIVFSNFRHGLQLVEEVEPNKLDGIILEGNILFQNGRFFQPNIDNARNVIVGGLNNGSQVTNLVVRDNYTYYDHVSGSGAESANFGGWLGGFGSIVNNYFMGGNPLQLGYGDTFFASPMTGNSLWGAYSSNLPFMAPDNTYHATSKPTGVRVFVRPNQYEPGRAHIAVYNWAHQPQVSADIAAAGLQNGDGYEIRDAWNFYGPPIATGTYQGSPVTIPMTLTTIAPPYGNDLTYLPVHSAPEFGAFVLLKASAVPPSPVPPSSPPATEVCGDNHRQ
jgi:hypothetical protein